MLADMGADVIRIDRPGGNIHAEFGSLVVNRSRSSVAIDLKQAEGAAVVLRLCEAADAIFEGFRPGVAERLGVGPDECLARNRKLVYGRMSGWGREGPLARAAGHDLNYIALSGALHAFGRAGGPPIPPLNVVGDFGGGGMLLAFGIVCGLLHAQRTGEGQVIDAAMIDGSAALMAMTFGALAQGQWIDERGVNLLDTGAPFYDVYETADGRWITLASIEPRFYALLREQLGLDQYPDLGDVADRSTWPSLRKHISDAIHGKTRDEWDEILAGTDVCFAPVLSLTEAPSHPHNAARGTFIDVDGVTQHAPAPRFSSTTPDSPSAANSPGHDTIDVLLATGFDSDQIDALLAKGAISQD